MSQNSQPLLNPNQAITNYDLTKVFILNNRYETETYTNSQYTTETLNEGTLMGRIGSGANLGQVVKCYSGASDGSQYPIGILKGDYVIAEGVATQVSICMWGDVNRSAIIFEGADNLNTIVGTSSRNIKDHLIATGINPVPTTSLTDFDNQ